MIDNLIKEAKKIIEEEKVWGKIDYPNNTTIQVGKYTVKVFSRPGRTMMTCDCGQGTKFPSSPTVCKHRLAAIIWLANGI